MTESVGASGSKPPDDNLSVGCTIEIGIRTTYMIIDRYLKRPCFLVLLRAQEYEVTQLIKLYVVIETKIVRAYVKPYSGRVVSG